MRLIGFRGSDAGPRREGRELSVAEYNIYLNVCEALAS
jgi:hypothetical protein